MEIPRESTETTGGPLSFVAQLKTTEFEGISRARQVAHQLETAIAVGLIADGERLPPERELAAQLGVSMLHIRQALATLRYRELIQTRRGRRGGSFVCNSNVLSQQEIERRLRERSTESLRDLGDLAGSVAASTARLAAGRVDEPDLTRLRDLAGEFSVASDTKELRWADSRFHIGLAVAAQSRRLTTLSVQVQGELAPLLWTPSEARPSKNDIVAAHSRIIEAIAEGDEQKAQALALAHSADDTERFIDAHMDLVMDFRNV